MCGSRHRDRVVRRVSNDATPTMPWRVTAHTKHRTKLRLSTFSTTGSRTNHRVGLLRHRRRPPELCGYAICPFGLAASPVLTVMFPARHRPAQVHPVRRPVDALCSPKRHLTPGLHMQVLCPGDLQPRRALRLPHVVSACPCQRDPVENTQPRRLTPLRLHARSGNYDFSYDRAKNLRPRRSMRSAMLHEVMMYGLCQKEAR